MSKRARTIGFVGAAQVAVVSLGVAWGFGAIPGLLRHRDNWSLAGGIAVLSLGVEGLRLLASRRSRAFGPVVPCACLALGSFAAWLIFVEAFLWSNGEGSFIKGVLLLLPFLLALSYLVRVGAWIGAAGSGLFFATSLAMLIHNALSRSGGEGFFKYWII